MKNALIYCRVSTEEQAEDGHHSLKTQLKLCKRQIEEGDQYKLASDGVYEDPGRSATNMNRPGLQDLLLRIQEDKTIDAVFIQDTDRLARNANDHLTIKALLRKHNVELVSVSQPGITDSPEGNFMDLVIAGVNQLQSQITARKTIKSLEQKFWDGWWPTKAPIGYLNVGDPEDEKKRIVAVDEEKAPFIQQAFKMYATGDHSVLEVRDFLFKKGFLSVFGNRIAHSKMIEILKNKFYIGEMHWRKMMNKGNHQPIIDKELFERVQIVMAEHNRYACRRRKFNFLLRGLVFCAKCGQRYTAEHHFKKNKSYYHCNRSGDNIKCTDKFVEVWDLEKQVADKFKEIQFSQDFIKKVVKKTEEKYKKRKGSINKEKQILIKQKLSIEKKRDMAEEKLFSGVISDEDFARNKKKYREQIEAMQDEIYQLEQKLNLRLDEVQEILSLVRNVYKTYIKAPDEIKRLYLGLFWERFEASEKKIVNAEPAKFIKALIKTRSVFLASSAGGLQTQKPHINEAFAQNLQRGACPPKTWRRRDNQLLPVDKSPDQMASNKLLPVILDTVWGGYWELNPGQRDHNPLFYR